MDTAARARLDRWTQSLLERADRLLDLADCGIPIAGDPIRLVFALVGGSRLGVGTDEPELAALRRQAREALADGEHVLWLTIGTLTYLDREAREHVAPLLLWPVSLVDDDGVTKLVAAPERSPRLNDALVAKLATDHALVFETGPELELAAVLAAAEALCTSPGWRVERVARLGAFSFAELDIWKDVMARNLAEPDASIPLQWLLGELVPPSLAKASADFILPLDADGSQLAAVGAAAAGSSFVLQGPPGTGKSQTIANLLVQCAIQGTSVLVVSDRVSALDAIQKRLAAVGLGEVCSVAGQPIERNSRPQVNAPAGAAVVRTRLAEVAASLDAHVRALHGIDKLGFSVHEALARLVELRTTPRAALAEQDAASLDRATFERRKRAVTELAESALPIEPVAQHPWQGSALLAWSADGTRRAGHALEVAGEAAQKLASMVIDVSRLVPGLVMRTPDQLKAMGALAQLAASSPRPGAELLTGPRGRATEIEEAIALVRARGGGALETPRDPLSFIAIAQRHRALLAEIHDVFTDPAALDATELWAQLKKWTTSMGPLRYVALRSARGAVRACAMPDRLVTDAQMLVALEAVLAERVCRAALLAAAEPAARWFGALAGDPLTLDLGTLEAALAWTGELRKAFDHVTVAFGEPGRQTAWRALVAQVAQVAGGPADASDQHDLLAFARLADAVSCWEPALAELATATGIPLALLGTGTDHLMVLRGQIDHFAANVGSLEAWTRFHLARRAAVDAGIRLPIVAIERGDLEASELAHAWERATLLAWADAAVKRTPELSHFDGAKHHMQVTSFADLDRGAMAVMRGRLPKLAPCVLATPQAISRCELPIFDLVVFDEASRLPVSHALGALARARATIIVGDVRQPVPADGAPGLLDVALSAGLPELVLSTHYRSRHHDLFAFANRRYYFDLVEVLPAAHRSSQLGLVWKKIEGVAEITGANRFEADEIVVDIKARLAENPRASIAVVTMSRAQQHLIEDQLETAGLAALGDDAILVGTPDRLQGEERDVVLLSIGEAADSLGVLAQPGAERWLAVAATRARQQLVIFSSFAPEDVPPDAPAAARGVADLLALARDAGVAPLAESVPASPVTAAIARALTERGWTLRHRVGTGAAAVELAVVDPDDPTRCVLAIEHDGRTYAEAQSTRERDRLRAQVLAKLGWRTHRVWSLDWWLDPERETMKAHGAIIAAVAANRQPKKASGPVAMVATKPRRRLAAGSIQHGASDAISQNVAAPAPVAAKGSDKLATGSGPALSSGSAPIRLARGAITVAPYTAAAIPCGRRVPDDMFTGRHVGELAKVVEQVLAAEAPIHVELLARRVASYFGVGKATLRIVDQVRSVLEGRSRMGDEPDVVWRADQDPASVPGVRVAGANAVSCRDITEIPLSEVAAAARIVVERASGLGEADLVRDCARLLGFARITERVTDRVGRGVQLAALRELIAIENGRAHLLQG